MTAPAPVLIVDLDLVEADFPFDDFLRKMVFLDEGEPLDDPSESAYIDAALAFDED